MTDNQVIEFLMRMTSHIAQLHSRQATPLQADDDTPDNPLHADSIPWMDEAFAAWMGFRGPGEQRQATAWDPKDLAAERFERQETRRGQLALENRELWAFLYQLRDELVRRCESRS